MKQPGNSTRWLVFGGLGVAVALAMVRWKPWPVAPARTTPATAAIFPMPAQVQARPLPVARASGSLQWTAADGKDPDVIRRLAHNELEYRRMIEENARILRRQLVYRKEPAAAVVGRAKRTGEPVRRLTLPGLDGREIPFEITMAELSPSGQQGAFAGRVAGDPDSMVTLAFKGAREAFTVIWPSQNLYLQADPREPGEVIVKQIDPATYVVGVCGNP